LRVAEPVRLFFALWPEPPVQQAFFKAGQRLSRHCGGHRTRRENIHLTLAFLGAVAPERVQRVIAVADQIQCSAFAIEFDRLGWWQQNQVAWAAPSDTPRPLLELYKALQLALVQEGFKFDERRFLPHVTLLRKAKCSGALIHNEPLTWRVDNFVLVRSTLQQNGPHYALLKRWALVV
jgi:2'-5' RNA ligase